MSMPRLALVTFATGKVPTGVAQAVRDQARIAKTAGIGIDYFLVNGEAAPPGNDEALRWEQYPGSLLGPRSDRWLKLRRLRSVRALESYDVLLLRYPLGLDLDPLALFRGNRQKIATIHHTKELEELLSNGSAASRYSRWLLERVNGRRILSRVDGIIGVTDEIRDYELARAGVARPAATISNGINVARVTKTGFVKFDGKTLRLFFVASDPSPWHGLDRLIASLAAYRGPVSLVLDVVGDQRRPAGTVERPGERAEVRFHGTLRGPQLDAVASEATLAVASLGLYRKLLRQACLLKTRDYLARGLPMIYGYDDVDLPNGAPFALQVPNSAALIDMEAVIAFAARMAEAPRMAYDVRAFAERSLDWSAKLRQMVEFASTLAN
ncbi:MAG: glycosyltransferase family 4 protein [Archangiaceae bacterium]|nr:glycosyltransferase family 4 protein [Archangiaceae bacterium]